MRGSLIKRSIAFLIITVLFSGNSNAQILKLKDVIATAIQNYPLIKAKQAYADASKANIDLARRDYLPNLSIAAQQDYGTINGQNGPSYGLGGGTASSGPSLTSQNWNAAFGALYLSNINWDFFTFGKVRERVEIAKAQEQQQLKDVDQELFQQEIRVSAAYLNLLAAKRFTRSQERNLERAQIFKNTAVVRAANGLIAGVDSSLASAEVSSARIALTRARDAEQEQTNRLGLLMGDLLTNALPDTAAINHIPASFFEEKTTVSDQHPLLQFYRQRMEVSKSQEQYIRRLYYPNFSVFGVFQSKASGFSNNYSTDQSAFSRNYFTGINPTRSNYLLGIGVTWNLTNILRTSDQARIQKFNTEGLRQEYEWANMQVNAQLDLANKKIQNALANYLEAPVQVKAASDAYLQKSTLYKNGLTTIVDLTQALYTLNRAETDRDIAYTNVWQSLLLKSAALGDYSIFINEF
jgi:outer membrane protein TolC